MAKIVVRCPQCGNQAEWSAQNRFRPFCSARCKLIDLGAWASDSYRIPDAKTAQAPAYLPDRELE